MKIDSLAITNYKSFGNRESVSLKEGVNLIAGQNNSGKSTLLESFRLTVIGKPHRSRLTVPSPSSIPNPTSVFEIKFTLSSDEVCDRLLQPGMSFQIPLPAMGDPFWSNREIDASSIEWLVLKVLNQESLTFSIKLSQNQNSGAFTPNRSPSYGLYEVTRVGENIRAVLCKVTDDRRISLSAPADIPYSGEVGTSFLHTLQQSVYAFQAERRVEGACRVGSQTALMPNASNLPEVILNLQSNPHLFARYNAAVTQILPQIQLVTSVIRGSDQAEILVWTDDPATEREDLAVPLRESGTGVGQILAIVYVVLTATISKTIIIDEPQSFLHPGAERRLLEFLLQHPQHQYILATHSPSVLASAGASTLTLVKKKDQETVLQMVDPEETESLRLFLADVGARLSDVFGADTILWVEGPTEEICFPKIVHSLLKRPLKGTAIVGVLHTGDLEGKHAKTVFDIYDRLSKGQGLLPPALAFIFDREARSEQQLSDLSKSSRNAISFLPRRLYENYLLDAEAIAFVINRIPGFSESSITPASLSQWMDENKEDRKYWKGASYSNDGQESWKGMIHGALLLADLFTLFSNRKCVFDKVKHSVELTDWLIKNKPECLRELANLLAASLEPA